MYDLLGSWSIALHSLNIKPSAYINKMKNTSALKSK